MIIRLKAATTSCLAASLLNRSLSYEVALGGEWGVIDAKLELSAYL